MVTSPVTATGKALFTKEQLHAFTEYQRATEHLSIVKGRLFRHEAPNWVLNSDLTHANERFALAQQLMLDQFGFIPILEVAA